MWRIVILLLGLAFGLCVEGGSYSPVALQKELEEFVEGKDATIGIGVIIDSRDTVEVNGHRAFPMLSVYKFPIAVALGEQLRLRGEIPQDSVTISSSDLKPDTYSPMRERYAGAEGTNVSLDELLGYSLQQSDNNASDIILKMAGGPENVMSILTGLGLEDVKISSSEEEMHENPELCYANCTSPLAMARLTDWFDHDATDEFSLRIKQLLESCQTGQSRLAYALSGNGGLIGHKTGTGFELPDGRLMAVNDVGYVHLPDGHRYSIAVFIENSGYDMPATESLIAHISAIVLRHLTRLPTQASLGRD